MSILDLKGSDFAHLSLDPSIEFYGGGVLKLVYQPKNRDLTIREVLADARKENQNITSYVIFQDKPNHFTVHVGSIKHIVVDSKCIRKGELTEELLKKLLSGKQVSVDYGEISRLVTEYDPQYCK